jgi:iron complex outermembrane receptor protein
MREILRTAVCTILLATATLAWGQETPPESTPLDELLETPISTAARYDQKLIDTPAAVTVITAEEIRRYGWETLADALNAVRGLYITYDRNYTYLGIRGFSRPSDFNNRVLVMIDGHSTNESVFGSTAVGTELALDLSEIERIEFVRGPGSVLYGSGAMFGVINIITRRGDSPEAIRAEVSAGSAGRRGTSVAIGRTVGKTALRIAANRRSVEGGDLYFSEYDEGGVSDGIVRDLDFDDVLGVLASATHGALSVRGFLGSRRKGNPTGAFETILGGRTDTLDERRFLDVTYAPRLSARSQIELRAFHDWYHYRGQYAYDKPLVDQSESLSSGAEIRTLFDFRSNHRLTLGARYIDNVRMSYSVVGSGQGAIRVVDTGSVYAQHEYQPRENLSIVAGFRYDRQQGYDGRTTPRLAVVYHPSSSGAVKFLYGEAFRTPSPWEREYESPEMAYLPNPDLEDETIRTAELVWEQRMTPEVLLIFSAYQFSVGGLIEQHVADDSTDNALLQFVNRGSVSSRGAEMEINYRSAGGFWTSAHYSLQKAQEQGQWLTNSPQHIASAGASGPIGSRLTGAIELLYESGRRTLAGTETRPWMLANATVSAHLKGGLKAVAEVRNAFDITYAVPAGIEHRQAAIEQDGRTFAFRLVYQH